MILFLSNYIVGILSFKQSDYNIEESAGSLEFELILSNPSSTDITVEIKYINSTASGK